MRGGVSERKGREKGWGGGGGGVRKEWWRGKDEMGERKGGVG